MQKIELLSPAGSFEALKQAIHNGANAVYLGGKKFGARAYAQNFNNEELVEAIKYAHLYDTKIYITINTIIYEDEFEDALNYIEFLHKNNVDAVIMQDIGLMKKVHERFPNLTIHASTQCHNHNKENIDFFKQLGVTRVILDRELSLEEIKNIDTDIELEVFIHGALCISYSGCCLMSYLNGGRSGNRGQCVGACRLPYKLIKNNKEIKTNGNFLLSTKELNTSTKLNELLDANITSFKIEGRMKSPEYVGFITKYYRTLIDNYYKNKLVTINKEDEKKLKTLFNREFTEGLLFNNNGSNLMNIKAPNHQGIKIGEVIETNKKFIKIKLIENLNQGDGIRFQNKNESGMIVNKLYNNKMLLTNSVDKNNIAYLENKYNINEKCDILKTTDYKLNEQLKNYEEKKLKISFSVKAKKDEKLYICAEHNNQKIEITGQIVEKALTSETTNENIIKQLSKLGNTPFIIDKINIIKDDQIFISVKELNELRRLLIQKLIDKKIQNNDIVINKNVDNYVNYKDENLTINILVRNEEQLKAALECDINNIYTPNTILHKKYKNTFLRLPRVMNTRPDIKNDNLLITEIGSTCYAKENNVYSDYYLNIINNNALQLLHKNGIKQVTLSPETNDKINLIDNQNNNVEIIIYGYLEAMITKYCPLNMLLNNNQKPCSLCKDQYYLKDTNGRMFPIIQNNCLTTILNHKPLNDIDKINYYQNLGIKHFRIELFNENYEQTKELINKIKNKLI